MSNHIHKWELANKDYDGNIEAVCVVDGCNETLSEDKINEILNAFQQNMHLTALRRWLAYVISLLVVLIIVVIYYSGGR